MEKMKLGIIALANDSGLGAQTRRLVETLKPASIMVIDSTSFSPNKEQHLDWYENFTGYIVRGFPNDREVQVFLRGLTHVLVCENPFNFSLLSIAKRQKIKVYIQSNYEFCDHLRERLTLPHKFLMPSYWKIAEMKQQFGEDRVMYLPPPIDQREFAEAREENFEREGAPRFLHIVGTLAANDRNGTKSLLESLKYTTKDFELVIRSQHELPREYMVDDKRVKYIIRNESDIQEMYKDFDALILPRRYGGLSLTTNEALMSGLPVIMTDISPNNKLLPKKWLVRANLTGTFTTRTEIDIYSADRVELAKKIDWLCRADLGKEKTDAFEIGYNQFSSSILKSSYQEVFNDN